MLVLHGAWLPAQGSRGPRFLLWGEAADALRVATRRRHPPANPERPRLHRFAARTDGLRDALAAVGIPGGSGFEPRRVIIHLPTIEGLPLPSPALAELPEGDASIVPWRIETLTCDADLAVGLLCQWTDAVMPEGVVLGESLRWWIAACRFALDLLARQRFLPAIMRVKRRPVARWRPLLDEDDDSRRFGLLLRAMPPACRAVTPTLAAPLPEAHQALNGFLDEAVDAVARGAVASVQRPRQRWSWEPGAVWLEALGVGGTDEAHGWGLDGLYHQYREWVAPAATMLDRAQPFRLCLRLEPPAEGVPAGDAPGWTVRYLLQATDDPSLIVPAAEVWQQRGASARFLDRRFANPRGLLLMELGRAARLWPAMEDSLRTPAPESLGLTTAGAYEFLREQALVLRNAGFGVLLPGLAAGLGVRLKLGRAAQDAAGRGPSMLGVDRIVQFDWQVALGGEPLSRREFEELARLKEPLVQVRGRWVELRPELVEQALAFFKRQGERGELSLPAALRLALAPDAEGDLPVEGVDRDAWLDGVLQRLTDGAARVEVEQPPGFVGSLRHYQQAGVSWLATLRQFGLGACLADDMGLGKTIIVIALLLHTQWHCDDGGRPGPALVICPTSVVGNWRHELARFAPSLRVLVHHGAGRNREDFVAEAARHDVVISSYPLLHWDEAALTSVAWDAVVLDEAQNIKNAATRAAQTARRLPAGWRAALTGTPVENRLGDLWSIFQFLNPGYLGSGEDFRRRFATPIERGHDPEATARLKALVSPFILRRLKTDRQVIADLPEKNEMKVFCALTKEQATLYQAAVQESLRRIASADGFARRGEILAALTRLKQICNHPALFLQDGSRLAGRSGKLARLTEMLEEVLAVEERALVFTQFAQMGTLLRQHLEKALGREALFLHGGTPAKERDRMVAAFQAKDGGPPVFILSLKAGGTGLNLTRANHVFHYDRWWNPAVENQATDRAFRIGQRRDVQVHKFLCGGTLEEAIDQVIERKVELSEAIVGANEAWITELSTDELRNLLTLQLDDVEG